MAVELAFVPTLGVRGTPTLITAAYDASIARLELFAFTAPDVTPTSEQGWFHLGTIGWSGGTLPWSVDAWNPGAYTIAAIAYDRQGVLAGHWFSKPDYAGVQKLPTWRYTIAPVVPGTRPPVGGPGPVTPGPVIPEPFLGGWTPPPDLLGLSWPTVGVLAALGVGAYLWWRNRGE